MGVLKIHMLHAGKKNDLALATSNSTLRRMDLSCELVGSVSFGYLYSIFGTPSILLTTALSILICPFLLYLIHRVGFDCIISCSRSHIKMISHVNLTYTDRTSGSGCNFQRILASNQLPEAHTEANNPLESSKTDSEQDFALMGWLEVLL